MGGEGKEAAMGRKGAWNGEVCVWRGMGGVSVG